MDEQYPNALPPQTRIGAVVLERAIGQGAWGIVYEGRHDVWGHVAVKEYFPSTYASRQTRGSIGSSAPQWQEAVRRGLERFGNEGRALTAIRHENVVAVREYIEQDDVALLVMEFVEGQTLTSALEAGRFNDPAAVMQLGATLIDTLQAIHAKNILHRDIAPDNVMIRADGSPVLIDFGGAAAAVASATRSTQNIVKDGYSPPEQYDTSANPTFPVGPWSDIYATAAVLYRIASGKDPAVSNARLLAAGMKNAADPIVPLAKLAPAGYPAEWLAGVDAGLALLPKDRPQSAAEWRKRFEVVPPKPGPNKVLIGLALASTTVAAAFAGMAVYPKVFPAKPSPAPTVVAVQTAAPVAKHTPKPRASHIAIAVATPAAQVAQQQPQIIYVHDGGANNGASNNGSVQTVTTPAPIHTAPRPKPHPPSGNANIPNAGGGTANGGGNPPQPTPAPTPQPTVAPTPAAPPPQVAKFFVNPTSIVKGQSVHVCYFVTNATKIELQPDAASLPIPKAGHCVTMTPAASVDYVLVASNDGGGTAQAQVHLDVSEPTPAPATPAPVAVTTPAPPPDACPYGYVWREAAPSDHVCVLPSIRTLTAQQNALASSRISATDHTYGPNTCAQGYVWREAFSGDQVCVTPAERTQAANENANPPRFPLIKFHHPILLHS